MPGFSITLLLLPNTTSSSAPKSSLVLSLLDDKAEAPGWKWSSASPPAAEVTESAAPVAVPSGKTQSLGVSLLKSPDEKLFISRIERACNALVAAESEITRMDVVAGDGDCGLTLKVRHLHRHVVGKR